MTVAFPRPGGEPLWTSTTSTHVVGYLTRLAQNLVQQAAPGNYPARGSNQSRFRLHPNGQSGSPPDSGQLPRATCCKTLCVFLRLKPWALMYNRGAVTANCKPPTANRTPYMYAPPLTLICWPVMKSPSATRKRTALAISSA